MASAPASGTFDDQRPELVAAEPASFDASRDHVARALGDGAEQPVADLMAVAVVDQP